MGEAAVATGVPDACGVSVGGGTLFATPQIIHERGSDGAIVLRSARGVAAVPRSIGVLLERWAVAQPERVFLAERTASGAWRHLTYEAAARAANAVGQSLLDRGLGPERPLMILAENGIDHGIAMLGAMHVGVPVVPVSTAYARLSQDYGKLRYIFGLVEPGLIYVDEAERYAKALEAIGATGVEIVASRGTLPTARTTPFASLTELRPTPAVDAAFARVGPDTVAKILFTSGSTGQPKGVINTQGMMCANQESAAAAWTFLSDHPPVIVDWLPWNHTFGGNHNFNMMLRHGGSLYIDEGKPVPALIGRTVANLREISPTVYFNVPRGFAALTDHLEKDEALRQKFFARLDLLFYAAAALPQSLWDRLERLGLEARGRKVPFISSWGLTETAPAVTMVHYAIDKPGNIGVPGPGMAVKLAPVGDKLEIRVKGPNVTPGYFKAPELTAAAFDAEGWLKTGDAVRLAQPDNPAAGLLFDGRTAENFKLSSGTWVNVGTLRTIVIAAGAPVIEDAVITGHDRDEIGLLIFPSLAGMRGLCPGVGAEAGLAALIAEPAVRRALVDGLTRHNAIAQGSSMRIARSLLLTEPPSIDANEITDKGYLNQRAVLAKRAALVERLHVEPAGPEVIVVG
jgi:feruloyl-CoA synthase